MGQRRKAREAALQMLYQIEMMGSEPRHVLPLFWKAGSPQGQDISPEIKLFATEIVEGTYRNRKEIDELIEKHSAHWRLVRMAIVDRNILRMAAYELLYRRDIPISVTLDEAIEIAKKFGTEESGAFINGILDQIAKGVKKDDSSSPHHQAD